MRSHAGAVRARRGGARGRSEPDLILTQELCRVCAVGYEQVNEVARRLDGDVTVLSLEPVSVEGIFNAINAVGAMTEAEDAALEVVEDLRERLQVTSTRSSSGASDHGFVPPRVVVARVARPAPRGGPLGPRPGPARRRLGGARRQAGESVGRRPGPRSARSTRRCSSCCPAASTSRRTVGVGGVAEAATAGPRCGRSARTGCSSSTAARSRWPGPRIIDGIEILAELFDPAAFDGMAPPATWVHAG